MILKTIDAVKDQALIGEILDRNQLEFAEINQSVAHILSNVRRGKDQAVREYTQEFDGVFLEDFLVSSDEIDEALNKIDPELKADLEKAKVNIENYHCRQLRESYFIREADLTLGQLIRPLEKVGIYVPGGRAAYPSTVLMNALPAKIAGVEELVMVTPPNKQGKIKASILVAAAIAGVDRIFKVGGAQGIAALAYGTESIPKVDKITGPGNIYVSMAKKQLTGFVGIDLIAGPSEILIIADQGANPKYIAADLISQAEHDELAAAILVTDYPPLADQVRRELERQVKVLDRKEIIEKALNNYGAIVITTSLAEAVKVANEIAPEHLEILTEDPFAVYEQIKNAGAIFLGEYSPEPVGDYFAGTNHTLPTSSTARFSSPLSVDDFIKKTSVVYYSKEALSKAKKSIVRIAEEEGLTGHANSVKVRFEDGE